jgi:hypothetical protein
VRQQFSQPGDGVWNTSRENHNQTNIMPNPDSIAEVKVLQNNYDAKYTIMGAGVIMVQTKSGTDDFHGGLWEFFRNTALDDRNYFSPTVPPEHQNIFGWQWAVRCSSRMCIERITTRRSSITTSRSSGSSRSR